jgi:hypothetical protein
LKKMWKQEFVTAIHDEGNGSDTLWLTLARLWHTHSCFFLWLPSKCYVEFPLDQHHDWVFPLLLETHDFIMVCLKFWWSIVCTHCGWWSQCGMMTACHGHSGIMKLVIPTVSDWLWLDSFLSCYFWFCWNWQNG